MSDVLLQIGSSPSARHWLRRLGLPLPVPEPLRRATGPWEARPLAGELVVSGTTPNDTAEPLARKIAEHLFMAGAEARVVGENLELYRSLGEAFGRAAVALDVREVADDFRADALVFDATRVRSPSALRCLYDFFHALAPKLRTGGRAVVFGRPAASADGASGAAAQSALEGFVRSLAKELGRRGATATLLVVHPGAEDRVGPVLRFVLSRRSSFVTAQPIEIHARVPLSSEDARDVVRVLDRKIALVTGAARGIGEATARALAAEGAHVCCLDRPSEERQLDVLARAIGGSALLIDVTAPDAPEMVARSVSERHGGVDVVVHNAGVTRDKTLARMSSEQWDTAIDVNLASVLRIDALLTPKALRDFGRIVCVSSVAGIAGNVGQTNYAASKAGIIGFVRKRADELAERGVTVNAVAPGFIETRLTAAMPRMIREAGRRLSALGQGGTPGDVAEAITFLAMPGAAGVSGTVLRVCGGALIGA